MIGTRPRRYSTEVEPCPDTSGQQHLCLPSSPRLPSNRPDTSWLESVLGDTLTRVVSRAFLVNSASLLTKCLNLLVFSVFCGKYVELHHLSS
jgi:hypothetical protein